MTEEDSESVHTDSQTGEESELSIIQLCALVEELSYGNSALKTETEMFEKYCCKLESRDYRPQRISDVKISAAEFAQLRSRRKSRSRPGGERMMGLTVEQKLDLVQKELEDMKDELRHMRANAERDLQYHEAIIEEAEIRWIEVQRAVHDFEKDILRTISKKKGSILATEKVLKYIEDMNHRRDNLRDKLRLKNISLKVQRKKLLLQLRQKEEVGEALHDVDFQQLKIENAQFLETIEARNQELIQLKLASGNTLQMLNAYKLSWEKWRRNLTWDRRWLCCRRCFIWARRFTCPRCNRGRERPRGSASYITWHIRPGDEEVVQSGLTNHVSLLKAEFLCNPEPQSKLHRAVEMYICLGKEILLRKELLEKIDKETIQVEEDRAKAEASNKKLRKQLAEFRAPQVMMYLREKILNMEMEKTIKMWERKVEIAEMSLKGYRKAWDKMKASNEQLQAICSPGK